ncbi:peptidoglycan editing factor PgeF [Marinomonas sp. THO17]|uniref:peptidoglycan editing factor PgeF n=1 Tax=Marinomonas sp. THO17 TaxID=3149048 RepID=UPI00336BDE55
MSTIDLITPNWPVPASIKAYVSTRHGGNSAAPYLSLNLGNHVGDDVALVARNRQIFAEQISMPDTVIWLNQVHGTNVVKLPLTDVVESADAAFSCQVEQVCAVLTADCLPVFLCDPQAQEVAVVHAGWRGLCEGVIESCLKYFSSPHRIIAWLGPAIGPQAFEVGQDVYNAFCEKDSLAKTAFRQGENGKWLADIYLLAKQRLSAYGVLQVYGGDYCTFSDEEEFFSYRRDGVTGRMASVIWFEED